MENNKKNYPDHIYGLCGYDKGKLYLEWIGEGKEILDLGCGLGIFSQFYSKNNKITGVDFEDKNKNSFIEKTKGSFLVMNLDGNRLDFPDNSFDVVVAGELLYYLKNREGLLKEISRVLKNDGIFIGSVINTFSLINKIRFFLGQPEKIDITQPNHIYYFSHRRLKKLLKKFFPKIKIVSFSRVKILKDVFPSLFSCTLGFKCKKQ